MVPLTALWLPILLAAVIVFVASAIMHMVLPYHKSDYQPLPDEDKLLAALRASFDFCSDALTKMDDSKLAETTEIFPGRQGSRAWASMILAGAWADHYAEAAMYLRLNAVLPPTAKK